MCFQQMIVIKILRNKRKHFANDQDQKVSLIIKERKNTNKFHQSRYMKG